jgi:hypothetical protein
MRVINRFFAEPVARHYEDLFFLIPERERKHPFQVIDARGAFFLVKMKDRLRVGQ